MQSVGEVMSIGRTFKEALQKAYRSLEVGLDGLEAKPILESDPNLMRSRSLDMGVLRFATCFRLLKVKQAFCEGKSVEEMYQLTKIDPWFLYQIKDLSEFSNEHSLLTLKKNGFSDAQISRLFNKSE